MSVILDIVEGTELDDNLTVLWNAWEQYTLNSNNWIQWIKTLDDIKEAKYYTNYIELREYRACYTRIEFDTEESKMWFLMKYS